MKSIFFLTCFCDTPQDPTLGLYLDRKPSRCQHGFPSNQCTHFASNIKIIQHAFFFHHIDNGCPLGRLFSVQRRRLRHGDFQGHRNQMEQGRSEEPGSQHAAVQAPWRTALSSRGSAAILISVAMSARGKETP